jgi:hypothetical protein
MVPVDEEAISLQDAVKSMRKIKNGSGNKRFIVFFLVHHRSAFAYSYFSSLYARNLYLLGTAPCLAT